MSPSWDPEDVGILLGAIKTRQKLPRTLVSDLEAVEHLEKENTERIFFDCGGRPAWLAYALTKRAAGSTGHVPGRGKRQRLISRLQLSPFESRRSLAVQLNAALGPDQRATVDRLLENMIHHAHLQRNRRRTQGSRESSMTTENQQETSEDHMIISANITSPISSATPSYTDKPPQISMLRAAEYFSEHGHVLVDASVVECIEIFPFYLANAIRKRPSSKGIHSAAISITLPCGEWMDCLMRIEVMGTKVDQIARDIFGAYMEAEDDHRVILNPDGSHHTPYPSLLLSGCLLSTIRPFFGTQIADGVVATRRCQEEMMNRQDRTSSVIMTIPGAIGTTAEIYILLRLKEGALLRERLFN